MLLFLRGEVIRLMGESLSKILGRKEKRHSLLCMEGVNRLGGFLLSGVGVCLDVSPFVFSHRVVKVESK
jgi:hypothetical protein